MLAACSADLGHNAASATASSTVSRLDYTAEQKSLLAAAEKGHAQAKEILDDMEADAMTFQEAEDLLAPNGSQKIMDEIAQWEQQTAPDYPLILKKLQQAAELQNYTALSDLTVIYGLPENATRYGIRAKAKTACILALHNNNLHGDLNKGHLDIYCNGEKVSEQEWQQVESFASDLSQRPERIRELW